MAVLSLIIPIFNEENTLYNIVCDTYSLQNEKYFTENNITLELVLVDDCSSDDSLNIAYKIQKEFKNIKVFSHKKNMGKGAALKTGFMASSGDYIGIQDADREYNPLDYIELLKIMMTNNSDVVYGSRYLVNSKRRVQYFWHTLMNKFLTICSNMFTNLDLSDMETCYKLFKKDVIKKIAPKLKENRFGFEPEITSYIARENLKIFEAAISYSPRSYEEGKKIKAKDGFRALYCIMHYGAPCAPLPMQLIIYTFIGALSAVVNIALFMYLTLVSNSLFLNIALAFLAGAIVNYILCILVLFRHKARWTTSGEIFAYIITLIIMGLLDYFVTKGLLFFGLNNFLSKSLSTLVGFVGNFLFRKYFVFPIKKKI